MSPLFPVSFGAFHHVGYRLSLKEVPLRTSKYIEDAYE
jgi:hypothetical protein